MSIRGEKLNNMTPFFKEYRHYGSVEDWLKDITKKTSACGESPLSIKPLAIHGWPDGTKLLAKYMYDVQNVVGRRINEPAMQWDVTGLSFDMGEAINGNPECWYNFDMPESKIIRFMFNPSAAGIVSENSLTLRGAMVGGLIDCLERAGNRVELYMVYGNSMDDKITVRGEVLVKGTNDALDIDRVAFLCAHPQSLRTLWFSWLEGNFPSLNGSSFKYEPQAEDYNQYDIVLERLADNLTEVKIMLWIKEQLKKFGVEMNTPTSGD